jgi:hypothetical protein
MKYGGKYHEHILCDSSDPKYGQCGQTGQNIQPCFNTSVITEEVKEDIKKSAIEIAKIGERKVYEYIMDGYVGIN